MMWIWIAFIAFVLLMLALDLGVFHRKAHVVSVKEALAWSAVWIAMGLSFSVFVYFGYEHHWFGLGTVVRRGRWTDERGPTAAEKYLTGYVVEKSPQRRQHLRDRDDLRLLRGAAALPAPRAVLGHPRRSASMRGAMIGVGAQLIAEFHWILYVFGVFLILTAMKMLFLKTDHTDPNKNIVVRLTRRCSR